MRCAFSSAACGLLFVTACGGGGNDVGSYASKFAEGDAIADELFSRPITEPSTLPTTGRAQYDGVARADLPVDGGGSDTIIGDLQLNADFARSTIGGQMDDFVERDGTRYHGQITVQEATIRRDIDVVTDFTFANDIDGRLTGNGQTYDVDGVLLGDFYGSANRYTQGSLVGEVTTGGARVPFDGVFIAKR